MTTFGLLLTLSGLSQREAATFLDISLSMIEKMARGTRSAPESVIGEMQRLIERQENAAAQAISRITSMDPTEVEIGYPADDHEAQALGWPCVGAWQAMAARVVARTGIKVLLVPRGSTVGTARAADAAGR